MPITLHDAFIPTARQLLGAMRAIADKAQTFAQEQGLEERALIDATLIEGMWSTPWHVRACWVHSAYAIKLFHTGEFTPDFTDVPDDWDAMRAMIDDAVAGLDAITPEEMEGLIEKKVDFMLGGKVLLSTAGKDFLLGITQPNLQFHAATFYDILRAQGVPLSKMDFMGAPRIIGS